MIKPEITYDDFIKIDIRVGQVMRAEAFPEAHNPSLKLWIDFGDEIGVKQTSAQITGNYKSQFMMGKQVLAVVNFPPRQIANFMSEVLVLGVPDAEGEVMLVKPEDYAPLGNQLY